MNITIPTIESLPTNPKEAACFIWYHQDALNAISQEHKIGTIKLGQATHDNCLKPKQIEALENYSMAILSECNELMENFFWKHWSAEAKEGKRWCLINPNKETGIGTIQNVRLEIIDLLFFVTSLLQASGYNPQAWKDIWERSYPQPEDYSGLPRQNKGISILCIRLAGKTAHYSDDPFFRSQGTPMLYTLFRLFQQAGMSWELTLNLYAKKLIKNYERQIRGRKQVGDPLSEKENSEVK
jgi:hypothetical protein